MELYLHIPFCVRKCAYCSFRSFPADEETMDRYITILLKEAERRADEICGELTTVYIGGGTPSLLPAPMMNRLLSGLRERFSFDHVQEFTSEANPGTVRADWLETLRSFGVNRLSLGVQAYQPRLLSLLGRIHSPDQVIQSFSLARDAGFRNINLDLIFGIPTQTLPEWRETLRFALSMSPEHISAYGLIPEEGTPLGDRILAGTCELPDPEAERAMYDDLFSMLKQHGLFQYEISNFAKPGFECRHNIGYWRQVPYLGLGLSAASMLPTEEVPDRFSCIRTTNPKTLSDYLSFAENGFPAPQTELTHAGKDAEFETMMLGLRMTEGVSDDRFFRLHGKTPEEVYGPKLRLFSEKGLMEHGNGRWFLTRRGMDIQNTVLVELME